MTTQRVSDKLTIMVRYFRVTFADGTEFVLPASDIDDATQHVERYFADRWWVISSAS